MPGIPLVSRPCCAGSSATFEKYNARPSKSRKVNGLAYCSQEVLAAAENMKEASVGTSNETKGEKGFDSAEIAEFLRRSAAGLESAKLPSRPGYFSPEAVAREISTANLCAKWRRKLKLNLRRPASKTSNGKLTVLEEKLFAVLLAAVPDDEVVAVRAQADRGK